MDAVEVKAKHWEADGVRPIKVDHDNDSATATQQLPAVSVDGANILVRFHVSVAGVARSDFTFKAQAALAHNEDAWWYYDAAAKAGIRTKLSTANPGATTPPTVGSWSFVSDGKGNYTATIYGLAATEHAPDAGTAFMLSIMGPDKLTATVVAVNGAPAHDSVSDAACKNCHGNHVWRGAAHDVTNPDGVGPCVVCHNRGGSAPAVETRLTGYVPEDTTTTPTTPAIPAAAGTAGTGLMGIVHGIHNSHNMPDRVYTWKWSNGNTVNFSKGFPGNMHNCATCHDSADRLAAVLAAPLSYALCISCHDGFDHIVPLTPTTSCSPQAGACHDGQSVSSFHNGLVTERAGLIWNGADQSMVLAKRILLAITGTKVNGTNLEITWTATDDQAHAYAPYDPCNSDYAAGPVFFGKDIPDVTSEGCTNTPAGCDSNMSMLRSYAQADDWVNDGLTGASTSIAPGQPNGSDTLKTTNTTCDANHVATTVVPLQNTTATRGIVALQGKPQVRFPGNGNIVWVRSTTPTREFVVADGTLPAVARRQIVDVEKCNKCHPGTLYQHGGSRVDSIELCVMCHNPSSSEQNRRIGMGVDAAEAYDGLPGQTYDLRTMVHAIHAAGAEYGPSPGYDPTTKLQIQGPLLDVGRPLMFYRSNGIFFFGSTEALAQIATWPTDSDCISCVDEEDGPLTFCKVYGSSPTGTKPVVLPDGSCKPDTKADPLPASTDGTWRPHRLVEVHYPRALNDCSACHVTAAPGLPDGRQAVAVTFDAGAEPWNNLQDDALIGPSAASCMSCHQSGDALKQFYLRQHAYDNGWAPSVFEGGRQTLIDALP